MLFLAETIPRRTFRRIEVSGKSRALRIGRRKVTIGEKNIPTGHTKYSPQKSFAGHAPRERNPFDFEPSPRPQAYVRHVSKVPNSEVASFDNAIVLAHRAAPSPP